MNDQEKQIVRLLLNEMAFEGAIRHFGEAPPDIPRELFERLETMGFPQMFDGRIGNYGYEKMAFDARLSVFENCYKFLRIIRNNIIHANKAARPDTPKRLGDLLAWSDAFIGAVYSTNSDFARRAQEIKAVLRIESF
jgi:hypothetical protein